VPLATIMPRPVGRQVAVATHLSQVCIRPSQPRWHSYDRAACLPPVYGGLERHGRLRHPALLARTSSASSGSGRAPLLPPRPAVNGHRRRSPSASPSPPPISQAGDPSASTLNHSGSPRLCLPSGRAIRRTHRPSIDPSGSHPGRPSDGRSGGWIRMSSSPLAPSRPWPPGRGGSAPRRRDDERHRRAGLGYSKEENRQRGGILYRGTEGGG